MIQHLGHQLLQCLQNGLRSERLYLLPLRLFIGLGWLRASVEKLMDPHWYNGEALLSFFHEQIVAGAIYFPFYDNFINTICAPNALVLGWVVMIGELLVGMAIMTGTLTTLALLAGLFMNLNFILIGSVNPSAFYIIIQVVLLMGQAGTILSVDALLSAHLSKAIPPARWNLAATKARRRAQQGALILTLLCGSVTLLSALFIRDYGPSSVDDPAMLLSILSSLSGLFSLGLYLRNVNEPSRAISARPPDGLSLLMLMPYLLLPSGYGVLTGRRVLVAGLLLGVLVLSVVVVSPFWLPEIVSESVRLTSLAP